MLPKNGQLVIQKGKNADIVGDFGATNRNKYATMHICFFFHELFKGDCYSYPPHLLFVPSPVRNYHMIGRS